MSTDSPKHVVFENLASVAQALGHEHRLELLEAMAQGPRSVEDLARLAGLTMANASRHLQLLRRARLAETERRGKRVFYRLAGDVEVVALLKALGRVGERNIAEVRGVMRDFFHDRDALEAVSREELAERLNAGQVTVLDVRPEAEYALGHVPGAINIPAGELERRLADLPEGHEVIAYCRGPYCVMSFEAVAALRARGFKARRLEDGFPEWKAAGLAVEAA
ncbi:MAG: metalloregulator ArsR/SmtB family transcription factor [Gemmatimonadales bacterium]|nr:metalloregulator ArsR/SmtB family transcription factor [Gemmatimonadales bacterium]